MYWPVATPRIYATTSQASSQPRLVLSHDGVDSSSMLSLDSAAEPAEPTTDLSVPATPGLFSSAPITPRTPAVNSVEHDSYHDVSAQSSQEHLDSPDQLVIPSSEPIVALRVSRTGHLFATITATSLTVWQTKVRSELRACARLPGWP